MSRITYEQAFHRCEKCKRGFVYGDSLKRHNQERHPKAALKATRARELEKQL